MKVRCRRYIKNKCSHCDFTYWSVTYILLGKLKLDDVIKPDMIR